MRGLPITIALSLWTPLLVECLSFSQSLTAPLSHSRLQGSFRASLHNIPGCHNEEGLLLCKGLSNLGDGTCGASALPRILSTVDQTNWHGDKSAIIRAEAPSGWLAAPLPQFDVNHLGAPAGQWQMVHPKGVFILDGFLSDFEADAITKNVQHRSSIDSEVVAPVMPLCAFRRSTTWIFFGHEIKRQPFPLDFMQRIEKATGIPQQHYEPTQVVEYTPGDFFSDHYDTSPCDHIGSTKMPEVQDMHLLKHLSCDEKTRRQGTVIVYLTGETEGQGGATYFPKLDVRVKPKKGRAVFFRPTRADGSTDPWMLHTAETLTHGKKFLLQQWIMHGTM
jgi:prolyl 4-hydroxylase